MRLLKTTDAALAEQLLESGFHYTLERSNRQVVYCFPADELDQSTEILSQFAAEAFFMEKTLSF
jgi:hypothetical protein